MWRKPRFKILWWWNEFRALSDIFLQGEELGNNVARKIENIIRKTFEF
jgi:hypothetical protein